MALGPFPEFAWSASRQRTLDSCARRYYWDVYGAWNGWLEDAAPEARLAYRLKKLAKLDLAVGTAIHRRAFELTEAARAVEDLPSVDVLRRRCRDELGALYRTGLEAFRADPKANPMLHSFYYGDAPEKAVLDRVREKLDRCLPTLREMDLWSKIRDWQVGVAFASDPDEFVEPTLAIDATRIYATPDLVLEVEEEPSFVVLDWKTGRPHDEHEQQMAVYGLFVQSRFGARAVGAQIVYLLDGNSRRVELTSRVLDETKAWIRDSIGTMRGFVADVDLNRSEPKEAFPLADNRWECKGCNFLELCREELQAAGPLPWER